MDAEADLAHLRRLPCGEQRRDVASLLFRAVAEERTGESAMCTYCWCGSAEQEEDRDLLDVRERTATDARKRETREWYFVVLALGVYFVLRGWSGLLL